MWFNCDDVVCSIVTILKCKDVFFVELMAFLLLSIKLQFRVTFLPLLSSSHSLTCLPPSLVMFLSLSHQCKHKSTATGTLAVPVSLKQMLLLQQLFFSFLTSYLTACCPRTNTALLTSHPLLPPRSVCSLGSGFSYYLDLTGAHSSPHQI